MPWFVLYTNPNFEKKVAEDLNKIGVEAYCPTQIVVRQWSDRKKKVELPLFTSYVFVNIEEHKRDVVFNTKGVVRYLYWLGKPGIVKDEEISSIKNFLKENRSGVEVSCLNIGDRIILKEGVFKDRSGIIQSIHKNSIQLMLDSIGVVLTIKK